MSASHGSNFNLSSKDGLYLEPEKVPLVSLNFSMGRPEMAHQDCTPLPTRSHYKRCPPMWPQVCHPSRCLQKIPGKVDGQTSVHLRCGPHLQDPIERDQQVLAEPCLAKLKRPKSQNSPPAQLLHKEVVARNLPQEKGPLEASTSLFGHLYRHVPHPVGLPLLGRGP